MLTSAGGSTNSNAEQLAAAEQYLEKEIEKLTIIRDAMASNGNNQDFFQILEQRIKPTAHEGEYSDDDRDSYLSDHGDVGYGPPELARADSNIPVGRTEYE